MGKPLRASIRVIIISSRTLVRSGLAALGRGQPQIQVIGELNDWRDAASFHFDVALFDAGSNPQPLSFKFIALLPNSNAARAWVEAGAAGIVLETMSVEELLTAIRQVARGETYLPLQIVQQMVTSRAALAAPRDQPSEPLTDREREVLRLLAQGLSNKDIAQKLYLSVRTVEGHLANIYGKLQVKSRTEAALWVVQNL